MGGAPPRGGGTRYDSCFVDKLNDEGGKTGAPNVTPGGGGGGGAPNNCAAAEYIGSGRESSV